MYVCDELTQVDLKSVSNRIRRGNGCFFITILSTILFVQLCPSCEQAMHHVGPQFIITDASRRQISLSSISFYRPRRFFDYLWPGLSLFFFTLCIIIVYFYW